MAEICVERSVGLATWSQLLREYWLVYNLLVDLCIVKMQDFREVSKIAGIWCIYWYHANTVGYFQNDLLTKLSSWLRNQDPTWRLMMLDIAMQKS